MSNTHRYRYGEAKFVEVPVANATVVEIGDLLRLVTGAGVPLSATTQNADFYCIAVQAHASGDGDVTIRCMLPIPGVIYEFALDSTTTITYGDKLQWNASQALKKSATDPIAHAVEDKTDATTILVSFYLPVLLGGVEQ